MAHEPAPSDPAPGPTPTPRPKRIASPRRWGVFFGLFFVMIISLAWLTASQAGFSRLWRGVAWASDQALTVEQVQGTFWDGFTLYGVHFSQGGNDVRIDRVVLEWAPEALEHRQLWVKRLDVGLISLTSSGPPSAWPALPANLALPFGLRVDVLRIAGLSLPAEGWNAYDLDAAYRYDGLRHHLVLNHVRLPEGEASALLNVSDRRPFALDGVLDGKTVNGATRLRLSGSLQTLHALGTVRARTVLVDLTGVFVPFAALPYQRIQSLDFQATGVDPQTLMADWPKATLDVSAHIVPDKVRGARGVLTLRNRLAGAVSDHLLPLKALNADLLVHDSILQLTSLTAQLPEGEMTLSGELQPDRIALDARLAGVALQGLYRTAPADVVSGVAALRGSFSAPRLTASLHGKVLNATADLALERSDSGQLLKVRQLVLAAGGGALTLQGQLDPQHELALNGKMTRVDPSSIFARWPSGDINATLTAKGHLGAPLSATLTLKFDPSWLGRAPLGGALDLQWAGGRLQRVVASLLLAGNRLQAHGAYGAVGDRLQVLLDAPRLETLGFGLGGTVQGHLDLAGVPAAPQFSVNLNVQKLHVPGLFSARAISLDGGIREGASGPFLLNLAAEGVAGGAWSIDTLRARAAGTRARHAIEMDGRLAMAAHSYDVALAAQGGWAAQQSQWRGVLTRATVSGKPAVTLLSPLPLDLGPDRLALGSGRLSVAGTQIVLDGLTRQANGVLTSRGRFEGLDPAAWQPWVTLPFEQNLLLDGAWTLTPDGRGSVTIVRRSGDASFKTAQGALALGLTDARAAFDWGQGRTGFSLKMDTRLGQLEGKGALSALPQNLAATTALTSQLRIDLPDLSLLAAISGAQATMGGALSADLQVAGPLSMPGAYGALTGRNLLWLDRKTGVRLSGGELQARLNGRRLLIDRLRFASAGGEVLAGGNIDFGGKVPTAAIKVDIRRFSVYDRVDRRLVVSGQGELTVTDRQITLNGRVRADQGRLSLPKAGTPTLSDDVVIVGRAPPAPSALASLPLSVALTLDLGDRFTFSGQGLDVDLSGQVEVMARQNAAPTARGQVNVVKGSYKVYGQTLDIESGTITFVGALDNPNLSVRARRHLSPVGAGVEVLGPLSAPRLNLISNEAMSERDKLAWLVLGHAASDNTQDSNFLAVAAGSFAAGGLNDRIGLFDDLGVTQRESRVALNGTVNPAEQVLTVGKQLTQTFYLGYQYGLSSSDQAVKLMYQLSKGWSVILLIGNDASVESRYSLRFD